MVCEAPISEIIGCKDATGRVAKWAIELSPYTPHYERRDAVLRLSRSWRRTWSCVVDDPTEMALPPSRFSRFAIGGAVRGGAGGAVSAWRSPRG